MRRKQLPLAVPQREVPGLQGRRLAGRLLVLAGILGAVLLVWWTNAYLTRAFTTETRSRADKQASLFSAALVSELGRHTFVPLLLSRDPVLRAALAEDSYATASARLIGYLQEIGAASILLTDETGRVVAATDRRLLGALMRDQPQVVDALRTPDTIFAVVEDQAGRPRFYYSRRVTEGREIAGVVAVEVGLERFERDWAQAGATVVVSDSTGRILLSSVPGLRGRVLDQVLSEDAGEGFIPAAIRRALPRLAGEGPEGSARIEGISALRVDARVPFRGWWLSYFVPYASVRERVNAVLALEIMVFAILLAFGFYILNRRAELRAVVLQRESAELRRLNERLQREIAAREEAQASLRVAEQTLAQSQKLAALGEMAAAVSHELNQPLAAMKTYLAGSRLLLGRRRIEEALSSFQRIDDLIERMGHITRQLKGYARHDHGESLVDLREAADGALQMMAPQLGRSAIRVVRSYPDEPVTVRCDRIRLEQVIVNLLRNAVDAVRGQDDAEIDILIARGEEAILSVRDNGPGIKNLERLFEPFYTTKEPGKGVGLGLAISSGIMRDMGGRLTARNEVPRGAVLEMRLPLADDDDAGGRDRAPLAAPADGAGQGGARVAE